MTAVEAIHAAARRYCIENSSTWKVEYSRRSASKCEGYDLFPRYLVLDAILAEIERFTPADAPSAEQMLLRIVIAAKSAISASTENLIENSKNEESIRAMKDERNALIRYINSLTEQELERIEPLPFRRVLSDEEFDSICQALTNRWDFNFPWYPLREGTPQFRLLTFHTDYFDGLRRGREYLRGSLRNHGVTSLWELREFSDTPSYEEELSLFDPICSVGEGCWTAPNFDWIVYASHESSITLAGDWLISAIQASWPDWEQRQYGGPFSTEDLRGTWESTNGGVVR